MAPAELTPGAERGKMNATAGADRDRDPVIRTAAAAQTVEDLAALLRMLRRRDARRRGGSVRTYRELATKTGWALAAIGEYFTGRTLPPTDRFDILVGLLDGTPGELRALATARDRAEERRRNPGPGSEPYAVRQLPAQLPSFVGRAADLARLGAVRGIAVVSGMAGVGKTALAVYWAHHAADRFPDGQLYADLRGFHAGPEMDTAQAVRVFLDALGVPAHRLPAGLDGQAALYRSLLAGRRMLVVLDNARDPEHARPLLPGSGGNLVVVTSRNRMDGLVAAEGADPVVLDLPSDAEARKLLIARLGTDRVTAEREAVDEIVARCAHLPLALAIVGARAATQPERSLATVANELRAGSSPLTALDVGDPATDVRSAFSWSYDRLGADAARLFRLLGKHLGPDIDLPAMVSLAAWPPERTATALAELARGHLVRERPQSHFGMNELLRAYAAERAEQLWREPDELDR